MKNQKQNYSDAAAAVKYNGAYNSCWPILHLIIVTRITVLILLTQTNRSFLNSKILEDYCRILASRIKVTTITFIVSLKKIHKFCWYITEKIPLYCSWSNFFHFRTRNILLESFEKPSRANVRVFCKDPTRRILLVGWKR